MIFQKKEKVKVNFYGDDIGAGGSYTPEPYILSKFIWSKKMEESVLEKRWTCEEYEEAYKN